MRITFNTNEEEYYLGWKFRRAMTKTNQSVALRSIIFAIVMIAIGIVCRLNYFIYVLALFLIASGIFSDVMQKKSVIRTRKYSPILCSQQSLLIYDEGIELINSYEKVFAPWASIYAVEESPKYVKIMATYSKGVAVINKERYGGKELDDIMNVIKAHTMVKEVRK
jgi:hypothetical protein